MSKRKSEAAVDGSHRRQAEVNAVTSKDKGDEAITKEVRTWMRDLSSRTSVELVLTHPVEAMKMGLHVGQRLGLLESGLASELAGELKLMTAGERKVIDVVNRICGVALNARKRGLLKSLNHKAKERSNRES